MRISKVLSVITLVLLACQSICGFSLTKNPALTANGPNGFHMILGITVLIFTLATTISIFGAAKKAGRNQ
jgi:hypothetical protein